MIYGIISTSAQIDILDREPFPSSILEALEPIGQHHLLVIPLLPHGRMFPIRLNTCPVRRPSRCTLLGGLQRTKQNRFEQRVHLDVFLL